MTSIRRPSSRRVARRFRTVIALWISLMMITTSASASDVDESPIPRAEGAISDLANPLPPDPIPGGASSVNLNRGRPEATARVGVDTVSIARQLGAEVAVTDSAGSESERFYASKGVVDVFRTTKNGLQLLAVLEDSTSPNTLHYQFGAGTTLEEVGDGSVLILIDGRYVGQVAAPWAEDSAGTTLETHYTITGRTLTQYVDTRGATFPVVSDPYITFGLWVYVTFRHNDVHTIWNTIRNLPTSTAITFLCFRIPHPAIALGCTLMAVWMYNSIRSTFEDASAAHTCVRFNFSYSVLVAPLPPSSWYVYNCGT